MRTRFIVPAMLVLALTAAWVLIGPRDADAQEGTEYTVVPGDTCWDIAERFGYDGSMFDSVIYYPNEAAIENNVAKYGWADSAFCHWIHPGLRLIISGNPGDPPRVVGTGAEGEPRTGGNSFVFAPTNVDIDVGNGGEFDDDWLPWLLLGLLALLALGALGAMLTGREGFGHHHHDAPTPPTPASPPAAPAPPVIHVIPLVIELPDLIFVFENGERAQEEPIDDGDTGPEGKGSKDEPSEDPVT